MSKVSSGPRNDKTIQFQDGRTLGYAEYGNADGKVLFYFHGHPSSRIEARFLAKQSVRAGIRLIGMDRPGMGLSSYVAGRSISDWPTDVERLADKLHIDRFSVVGFSGGGPYALACAQRIPERLITCGIISGVGHTSPFLSFLSMWLPWLLLPMSKRRFQNQELAEQSLEKFVARWIEPDRKAFQIPGISEIMAASLVEALRPGTKGAAYDGMLIGQQNWGFPLEKINFSKIYLWHGELDNQISVSSVRLLTERLAHCEASYYPDEGHLSLIVNHASDILETLL